MESVGKTPEGSFLYNENHAIVAWFNEGFTGQQKAKKTSAKDVFLSKARQIVKPSATLFSKIHLETKNQGIYEDDC